MEWTSEFKQALLVSSRALSVPGAVPGLEAGLVVVGAPDWPVLRLKEPTMTPTIHSITDEGPVDQETGRQHDPVQSSLKAAIETVETSAQEAVPVATTGSSPRSRPKVGPKASASPTKSDAIVKCLRRKRGATLADLMATTGWQPHSVRGFLSATVRKKLGLALIAGKGADGALRYRIEG